MIELLVKNGNRVRLTDGDYRYQSWTNHESFVEIANRRMGLEAWREASDAGFQ